MISIKNQRRVLAIICLIVSTQSFSKDIDPTVDVNVKNATTGESSGALVIERRSLKNSNAFEINEGEAEIEGDAAPLLKEARSNWKKACKEWKDEMKENNKDNKIISLNCGKMECTTQTSESLCRSKAAHKIRVKMQETP